MFGVLFSGDGPISGTATERLAGLNTAIQTELRAASQRGEDKERGSARGRTLGRGEISDEGALLPFPYGASPRIRAPRPAKINVGHKEKARMINDYKELLPAIKASDKKINREWRGR